MQPSHWQPSVDLSEQEERVVKEIRKAKLFVFLRQHRHELFDEAFQQELASLYHQAERGRPPVAPAMLAQPSLEIARQVKEQDVQVDEKGKASLIKGVAKDRRISVEDSEMRHGRKSRSMRVDGYKRHVLHDLDTGLIRAVGITPANMPEASVTEEISADLDRQEICLKELHIDRAYLSSHLVRERSDDLEIYCKAWPVRIGKRFHKQAFRLDWEQQIIRCPASQEMPLVLGGIVHFPKEVCAQCPLQIQCTTSPKGRSVSIHPDEALLIE